MEIEMNLFYFNMRIKNFQKLSLRFIFFKKLSLTSLEEDDGIPAEMVYFLIPS